MKRLPSLTIFFPAYNDEHTIADLVSAAFATGGNITSSLEVIVINDGSTDNTEKVLSKLQKKFPDLGMYTHKENRGYGAALRTGFSKASGEWVFYTDGDGQYDPKELVNLVAALEDTIDVVNGYKRSRADSSHRIILGALYNMLLHVFFRLPIRDIDCDFRLIRRSKLQEISLTSSSGSICFELIQKLNRAGARFREVPVHHYPRRFGRSQFFHPRHLLRSLRELLWQYDILSVWTRR